MGKRPTVILGISLAVVIATGQQVTADSNGSSAWFTALSPSERTQIQTNLIVTGFYDGAVDGTFGPGTFSAITKFQTSIGDPADGALSNREQGLLWAQASAVFDKWGMTPISDDQLKASYMVPKKLTPFTAQDSLSRNYTTGDGSISLRVEKMPISTLPYEAAYIERLGDIDAGSANYARFGTEFWVVSGQKAGQYFYTLMHKALDDSAVGFTVTYSKDRWDEGGRLAVFEASRFAIGNPAPVVSGDPTVKVATQEPPTSTSPSLVQPSPAEPDNAPTQSGKDSPVTHQDANVASLSDETIGPFKLLGSDPTTIILSGDIDENTPLQFDRAIKARPLAKTIILNSDGGWVDGGLLIANQVHDRGMTTEVPTGDGCYSACSFILLAGTKRQVEGQLGVHQISMPTGGDLVSGQMKLSDVLEDFTDFGVDPRVVSLMLRTPPNSVHVFSSSELQDFHINN